MDFLVTRFRAFCFVTTLLAVMAGGFIGGIATVSAKTAEVVSVDPVDVSVPVYQELQETVKAVVREVVSEDQRDIVGTNTSTTVQTLWVEILDGMKTSEVVSFDNDLVVLKVG